MSSSLHNAYLNAAYAELSPRFQALPQDPAALAAFSTRETEALFHGSTVPSQRGVLGMHDYTPTVNHATMVSGLQTGYNGTVSDRPPYTWLFMHASNLHATIGSIRPVGAHVQYAMPAYIQVLLSTRCGLSWLLDTCRV